jgi:cell division ATPase FtsA
MLGLFQKQEEEIVAVFDIGNGSIGAALVSFKEHGAPVILYTHREPITYIHHITSKRLLESMLVLLKTVAARVQKEGLPKVKALHHHHSVRRGFCIFSSPWYLSQTRVMKVEKEEPFEITSQLIDTIIKKEEEQFLQSLKEGKYEQMFGHDTRLLEKKIIHTRLNGYEIAQPMGKKARELELTFFSSFISSTILKSVQDTLSHFFHFKSIQFYSYALASWSVVRDMNPDLSDFLFIDVTGEVTDVMLTHDGVLSDTVTFPLGRSMVLRKIVDELSVPPEVAVSFLSLIKQSTGDKVFIEKMKNVLTGTQEFWFTAFLKTVKEFKQSHMLPKKIFITADADVAYIFKEALSAPMPEELNMPENKFEVIILDSEIVKAIAQVAGGVSRDAFLSIDSQFLNKIAFGIV